MFSVLSSARGMQVDARQPAFRCLTGTIEARGKAAEELARLVEDSLRGRYVRNRK